MPAYQARLERESAGRASPRIAYAVWLYPYTLLVVGLCLGLCSLVAGVLRVWRQDIPGVRASGDYPTFPQPPPV
jgi:hypothetical protein